MANVDAAFLQVAGRTAAILTTGEVSAPTLQVGDAYAGQFGVEVNFTLGSLTDVTVRFYVSSDNATWRLFADSRGNDTYALAANSSKAYQFQAAGWKYFKHSFQGSGTVTSSSASSTYRMLRRGSQG